MLILAAVLGILVYGIVAATWGNLNPTLGFTDAQNGTIAMWQAIGLVVASISVGPLIDLKGKKVALLASYRSEPRIRSLLSANGSGSESCKPARLHPIPSRLPPRKPCWAWSEASPVGPTVPCP